MNNQLKNILHVTHSWGGGLSVYIDDLKNGLKNSFNIYVLRSANGKLILEAPDGSVKHFKLPAPIGLLELYNQDYKRIFELILCVYGIDLIHINITLSHTFDVFDVAHDLKIPIIYTAHEYFYICPTFHLVDKEGMYCQICKYGSENAKCINNHPYVVDKKFNEDDLKKWRSVFNEVKDKINLYVFPSYSSQNIFESFYSINSKTCRVIPHGVSLDAGTDVQYDDELRVGILGEMAKHKGEALYKYILSNNADKSIKFYHFGGGSLENEKIINVGLYNRQDITSILKDYKIDVILLLSTWPETFSYTLSETLAAGIPPIVTNLGALKERVGKDNVGWIVDYKSPDDISELLYFLKANPVEIDKKRKLIKQIIPVTLVSMMSDYMSLYHSIIDDSHKLRISSEKKEASIKQLTDIYD